jgi:DNA processing protein
MIEPSIAQARSQYSNQGFRTYKGPKLKGKRSVMAFGVEGYPEALMRIPHPPERLYVVGDAGALAEGLAVIGARRATPYGRACATRFASIAAERGIPIISGGAYGCDSEAHRAALEAGGTTIVFLGGGCDQPYPAKHLGLFQEIVDSGGAVVSEHEWDFPPLPYTFRARNRLIAGLARATLIVEAGLPSGTFSTADEALAANKDVLVVPGAITSKTSAGSNRLLYQGATPIIDDETFQDVICSLFGFLHQESFDASRAGAVGANDGSPADDSLLEALRAEPMRMDRIMREAPCPSGWHGQRESWLQMRMAELERDGLIVRYPDGRYGPNGL